MAVWVDVTDQANWTAQRIVFDDTALACFPSSYAEDGTNVYTWDTDHWDLPTLTFRPTSEFADVPTLRYTGAIDPATVGGVRVTGTVVGNHTVASAGVSCIHITMAFDPQAFLDRVTPPYFVDDCGASGADLSPGDVLSDGTEYVLEITGDPGTFLQFMNNITMIAVCDSSDFCGPYMAQDTGPASFGLNITMIEFFTESLSVFWQDFVGCEEIV